MAYWYKIGLLVLNDDQTKFLVCQKAKEDITDLYIMPGGQMEESTVLKTLDSEIRQELSCRVDHKTLKYIGEYTDVAAGNTDHEITIDLYQGKLIGEPKPMHEIKHIHWISKADQDNPLVSLIIRNQIIPSLTEQGILK